MANFTENQPLPFAPYRSLPIDLYGSVIADKQDQYNQGAQRIQGTIDAVAGLEVSRDIDKQYLNQKVNDLTSKINSFAGQDWSNKSLVGQATSLASSISRDQNVQAAIQSTSSIKKAQSERQQFVKDGKTSAYTDYNLSKQIDAYNKQGLGAIANVSYNPYSDTHKKITDIIGKITKSSNESDNAYTLGADGKMVLSDAIVRGKFAGVSPQQIQSAIYAGLDGNDLNQLRMEGEYNYANQDGNKLKSTITATHQADIDELSSKKKILDAKIDAISDVSEKNRLQEQSQALASQIGTISDDNKAYMDQLDKGDLDSVRGSYHTTRTLRAFGNAFSYSEVSNTYQSNPMAQMAQQRAQMQQEYNLRVAGMQQDNSHFMMDYSLKLSKEKREEEEFKIKKEKGELSGGFGRVNMTVPQSELGGVSMSNFQDITDKAQKGLDEYDNKFLAGKTDADGKPLDKKWLDLQRQQYDNNPNSVPSSTKDFFDQRVGIERNIATNQQLITTVTKEADSKIGDISSVIPKDAPSITVGTNKITPEEIVSFNAKYDNLDRHQNDGRNMIFDNPKEGKELDDYYTKSMTPHEKILYDIRKRASSGYVTPQDRQVADIITHYKNTVNVDVSNKIMERIKFMNTKIAERTGESQRATYNLPTGKAEERSAARGIVTNYIERAKTTNTGLLDANGNTVDIDALAKMANDNDATYSYTTKGRTQYGEPRHFLSVGLGTKSQQFEITGTDKQATFGSRFEDNVESTFLPIQQRLQATGNGTTNFNGVSVPVKSAANPLLHNNDFQSIKKFSVKGDVIGQNGRYGLMLYIVNPYKNNELQGIEYKFKNGLVDDKQIQYAIQNLSDNEIYQMLQGKPLDNKASTELDELIKKAH